MIYRFLQCWVDGGVLGKNPSPNGVYWSVAIEGGPEPVMLRRRSTEHHDNSDSEWLAVREALTYIVEHKLDQPVVIYSDSRFVVQQFHGVYAIQQARHRAYYEACKNLAMQLPWVALKWVPRDKIVEKLGH